MATAAINNNKAGQLTVKMKTGVGGVYDEFMVFCLRVYVSFSRLFC